jgi:hypothetical protein
VARKGDVEIWGRLLRNVEAKPYYNSNSWRMDMFGNLYESIYL